MSRFCRGRRNATRGPRRVCVAALLIGVLFGSRPASLAAAPNRNRLLLLTQEHREREAAFVADLQALADFCEANTFVSDALRIRELATGVQQQTLPLDELPAAPLPGIPRDLPPVEKEWRTRLLSLKTDHAQKLYLLSQRAIRDGYPSDAFQYVREAAYHDPDHRQARKALGFVPTAEGWATPFAAERQRRGYVWHDRFGWLLRTQVARYENGERFYNGRWISAEKEASLRSDLQKGWEVLTEHFEIHTNHSLERGVELGVALEDFHRFFVRELAGFFNTPQQMQALFDAGSADVRGVGKRHVVYYFRTKGEYVAALKPKQSNIELTNGLYLPGDRCAYFYDDPDKEQTNLETLFHEVTHQLLGESARSIADVGQESNFWIVEGIACYMESFDRTDGRLSVGNPQHPRIHWARVRALEEDYFVPLQQFTTFGMRQFQSGVDLPTLQRYYSQASGMTHFFLHYDDGLYREAMIRHLAQIYSPDARVRARVQTLAESTGVSFEDLNRQYVQYLRDLPTLAREPATAQQ